VPVSIDTTPITAALADANRRLTDARFADALWARRVDVWTADPAVQKLIANRLGWLTALDVVTPHLDRLRTFGASVAESGVTDVVLLGMGGSSLAPEVLRRVIGPADGVPRFTVLDSVDPEAVDAALANAATSLFILASKSGGTIEPNSMAAEAERRLLDAGIDDPGSHFVAITDENTALHRRAIEQKYRDVFVNPSDIGGRYSALSYFGLVPAAAMGIDLDAVTAAARAMMDECRDPDPVANPGLALGAAMAAGALTGRDKLTLQMPDYLEPFGLWVEQLVAESTGKQGKGVVPIVGEPSTIARGEDRLLVTLTLPHQTDLGAEFFRWEFATAAAGWLLGINPFDEPNVQQAKDATKKLLDVYGSQRSFPLPEPHGAVEGSRLTLSPAAEEALNGEPAQAFLSTLKAGDYLGLQIYLPSEDPALDGELKPFRVAVASSHHAATMIGYGPRYLHSTGQLHKGGANNGVFIVVTADPAADFPIPGESFSFGVLEMAQALGDFQSLAQAGRRALHVHLPRRDPALLKAILLRLLTGS
jgi:transaldolase/glucose-6-phosphate isomerase